MHLIVKKDEVNSVKNLDLEVDNNNEIVLDFHCRIS